MSSLVLVLFAYVLLVAQSALAILVPMYSFAPNLLLPIAIFYGVSAEVHVVRGAVLSFLLGYMLDAFCGQPMGLQTFVLTASFMLARGAGVRLFPQGPVLQMLLSFVMAVAFGATVLALRAIFEPPSPVVFGEDLRRVAATLLRSAVATAVMSPLVFLAARRIEAMGVRKREQRTLSSSREQALGSRGVNR